MPPGLISRRKSRHLVWEMGTGDWGLGTGDWEWDWERGGKPIIPIARLEPL